MAANYDNAAWFYDRLAAAVFGDALNQAQQSLLHHIPGNAKILIIGGGTGKIIEQLSQLYPHGLKITYIELSEKMTAIARTRKTGDNQVEFITAPAEDVPLASDHDVIITSFLFDNFNGETLERLFNHLNKGLRPGGIWINTDFQLTGKWWQNILYKTMLIFFGILCGVDAKQIPDMDTVFANAHFQLTDSKTFYGEFMASKAYRKR